MYVQLSELLKCTESEDVGQYEKEINRINELIKVRAVQQFRMNVTNIFLG